VDLWGSDGNGGTGRRSIHASQDAPSETPPAHRSRSHPRPGTTPEPISNKQARFLFQLARKAGMRTQPEVASWIADTLSVEKDVYGLSKREASRAIDLLNEIGGNGR
jgi:hypothetical protein